MAQVVYRACIANRSFDYLTLSDITHWQRLGAVANILKLSTLPFAWTHRLVGRLPFEGLNSVISSIEMVFPFGTLGGTQVDLTEIFDLSSNCGSDSPQRLVRQQLLPAIVHMAR